MTQEDQNLRQRVMALPPTHKARQLWREYRRARANAREDAGVSYEMGGPAADWQSIRRGIERALVAI